MDTDHVMVEFQVDSKNRERRRTIICDHKVFWLQKSFSFARDYPSPHYFPKILSPSPTLTTVNFGDAHFLQA
jgi:hypothetical protein